MNCSDAQADLIAARAGAATSPAPEAALAGHLAECAACARLATDLEPLLAAISTTAVFPREAEVDWNTPVLSLDEVALLSAAAESRTAAEAGEARVDWEAFARDTTRRALAADAATNAATAPRRSAGSRFAPGPPGLARWMSAGGGWRALPMAASLLLVGVLTGYMLRPALEPDRPGAPTGAGADAEMLAGTRGPAVVPDGLFEQTGVELAKIATARYLADSRALLLGLSGLTAPCDGNEVDVSAEREQSRRLLQRKQMLDADLADVEVARARRLADEVGDLLADVAAFENCVPPARLRELRDQARQRQLLLRIEVITDELTLPPREAPRGQLDV